MLRYLEKAILEEFEEKIDMVDPIGYTTLSWLPIPIFYILNNLQDETISRKNPGGFDITPDMGTGKLTLSVCLYDKIPKRFKPIVFFHELVEYAFLFNDEMEDHEAHRLAHETHMEYAKMKLSPNDFARFKKWDSFLNY